jgi:hypothetical protein
MYKYNMNNKKRDKGRPSKTNKSDGEETFRRNSNEKLCKW